MKIRNHTEDARLRRIARIAADPELGEFAAKLQAHGEARDSDWMMRHDSREDPAVWLTTPISHSGRREDARDDSNYEIAERLLNEASSYAERCKWPDRTAQDGTVYPGAEYRSGGTSTRSDAWPGGTIETLLVRADDAPALRVLKRIVDALADYPVLDSEHCSDLEWDRAHPSDHECWSEDPECPCAVSNHDHNPRNEHMEDDDVDADGQMWCRLCRDWVRPGTRVGDGNTHDEDD